jgi:hypothetical protein
MRLTADAAAVDELASRRYSFSILVAARASLGHSVNHHVNEGTI